MDTANTEIYSNFTYCSTPFGIYSFPVAIRFEELNPIAPAVTL